MNAIQTEIAFASNNEKAQFISLIDSEFASRAIDRFQDIFQHLHTLRIKSFDSIEHSLRTALHAYSNINRITRSIYNIDTYSFSTQKQDTERTQDIKKKTFS